jgi:hypothetical protein
MGVLRDAIVVALVAWVIFLRLALNSNKLMFHL